MLYYNCTILIMSIMPKLFFSFYRNTVVILEETWSPYTISMIMGWPRPLSVVMTESRIQHGSAFLTVRRFVSNKAYLIKYSQIKKPSLFYQIVHCWSFQRVWFWSDGTSLTFTKWNPTEPNRLIGECCVHMNYGSKQIWNTFCS